MENKKINIKLDNETKTDTILSIDEFALFRNIPHHYLDKQVQIALVCQDFVNLDTVVTLKKDVTLNILRNPDIYGNVHFLLWNPNTEKPVANMKIFVGEHEAISDAEGNVKLNVPLKEQQHAYPVKADIMLENDTIYMPCGENDVLLTQ